ncbi:MAG: HAD family hydrolase [Gammaproteobacteria bacterium]|nr:HAD family hydrolase [Gammaproteobacteria bacterium]
MTLAIFDLDNTLLNDDSDYLWGEYLVEQKLVDPDYYKEKNDRFYEDYKNGILNIDDFLTFSLQPLTQYPIPQLHQLRAEFVEQKIKPVIAKNTLKLIEEHKLKNHTLMIISATNRFVTEPIAALLGIPHLLSTQPEIINNKYTGNYIGIPTFHQGKITALRHWLKENNETLDGSYFYSDSINDLPLLEIISYPIVVNPDDKLKKLAKKNNWKEINLNK